MKTCRHKAHSLIITNGFMYIECADCGWESTPLMVHYPVVITDPKQKVYSIQ